MFIVRAYPFVSHGIFAGAHPYSFAPAVVDNHFNVIKIAACLQRLEKVIEAVSVRGEYIREAQRFQNEYLVPDGVLAVVVIFHS